MICPCCETEIEFIGAYIGGCDQEWIIANWKCEGCMLDIRKTFPIYHPMHYYEKEEE